jgi:hypothetical protein
MKSGNSGGGKGPDFWHALEEGEESRRRLAMSLKTPDNIRNLQKSLLELKAGFHFPRRHILPRKEGGFSVYVSNILKHSLEILGLPISGFPGYVEKLCNPPHIRL